MIEICALASGSNGNCYYIGNEKDAVLIDVGISYKRLNERIIAAGLDKSKIKAFFISHEHSDHVQGARVCSKKMYLPAYFNKETLKNVPKKDRPESVLFFEPGEYKTIGDIKVFAFSKKHDAGQPCSFVIECNGITIGVMTDIGIVDETLQNQFSRCHTVFLETNYDKDMLWKGSYPVYIKKRIDSEIGHLSNEQALELVENHASQELKYIFLSHISQENNTLDHAMEAFSKLKDKYTILPTSRAGISEVIRI